MAVRNGGHLNAGESYLRVETVDARDGILELQGCIHGVSQRPWVGISAWRRYSNPFRNSYLEACAPSVVLTAISPTAPLIAVEFTGFEPAP